MGIKSTIKNVGKPLEITLDTIVKESKKSILIKNAAEIGKQELVKASPTKDIADNWGYEIFRKADSFTIVYNNSADIIKNLHYNSNGKLDEATKNGVNIAIIVDTGHATGDGKWIEGKHYLQKAIDNASDEITTYLRKEIQSK